MRFLLVRLILGLVFCRGIESTLSCIANYTSVSIAGNDLKSVAGPSSSCCSACQNTAGCEAWVWTNSNNGTCFLKNSTTPLVKVTGATTGIMSPDTNDVYSLIKTYQAPTFFNDFWMDNRNGHVFGFSQFADNQTAWNKGLVGYQNGKVYIGVDHTTVVSNSTWGRLGIRINSNQTYSAGLFVLSMDHLPVGPANNGTGWRSSTVWPAWWLVGETADNGEFDIYEGYTPSDMAFATIHDWGSAKWGNCTIPGNISSYYNGSGWNSAGQSQYTPHGTADVPFNNAGGGVYAAQWTNEFIRVWTFTKQNVPADIANNSPNPNPDTWGMPNAFFPFGANCNPNVINNDYIVFDIAFCNPPMQQSCEDIVRMQPSSFADAYFLINYVKVFCRPGETCYTGNVVVG